MHLANGTRLGPYLLIEKIGAGGMGEVYRAQDTRLDRVVAVKVLLSSVAADSERLRRFEQEAKTLAALNHPNILAVHDLGTEGGTPYLVSEFLEGETLREVLEAGALPVRKAIEYALGIAHGLAAGHSKGIVHRDIKPENVFLTKDGRIKILDFGLAKLVQPAGDASAANATLLTSGATQPGVVLGTVGYMSPEQVRGEPAEATSDIFSFGAVLYEMLSGRRAFKRETAAETMTAVLREDPPELTESGWHGPAGLQKILERCLEKNPRQRFQSASDLAFAIESLSGSGVSASSVSQTTLAAIPAKPPNRWRYAWLAAPLLVAVGGWWVGHREPAHGLPDFHQLTYQRGFIPAARFLHDGQTAIYGGQFEDAPMQIYEVRTNLLQPVPVSVPSAMLFAVSPNDQMLIGVDVVYAGHSQSGTLAEVPVSGGTPRPIQTSVLSADYGPDGKAFALSRYTGGKCVLEYPAGKPLYTSSGYMDHLRVSPDGKYVAFDDHPVQADDRGAVAVVDAEGKMRHLTPDYEEAQGVAWKSSAEVWYTADTGDSNSTMKLNAVDLAGKVRTVMSAPAMLRLMDIASDGRVLLDTPREMFTVSAQDVDGKLHPHLEIFNGSLATDISPDGKVVLIEEFGGSADTLYLAVYRKTDGSPPIVLGKGAAPKLSPDGKTVAALLYTSPPQLALYPIGIGESRTLPLGDLATARWVVWLDATHMLVGGAQEKKDARAWLLDLDSGTLSPWGPAHFYPSAASADGKRVAGFSQSGATVYDAATQQMTPLPGFAKNEYVSGWTSDGQALLVETTEEAGSTVYRQDLKTGKRTLIRRVDAKDKAGAQESLLLPAQDGKSYVFWQAATHSTLWAVDGVK
jgi:hypothetical protein